MTCRLPLILALLGLAACSEDAAPRRPAAPAIDDLAREYLFLELSMGRLDAGHVDAYFGPDDIRKAADEAALDAGQIRSRVAALEANLRELGASETDSLRLRRLDGLLARLGALVTRIKLSQGVELPFDAEAENLFGTRAPDYDAAHFDTILDQIDELMPGNGSLARRVEDFRARFAIPPDRLSPVFDAAIAECRRRTVEHIELPPGESFTLEYVTDKPWSGYNWYQGNATSLIQINTDLPIFVSRAVDLGCHEGYPGHHTFNALLEKNLVDDAGWVEFSLYPLFSPQSLIAEGSGNYGIELAFPDDERVDFEKSVLFPLAGLDAAEADRYYALLELMDQLGYAGNEAARDYLNGNIDRQEAIEWLVDYTLSSPERARQRVDFFDTYRSYVINYNLGKDLVRDYVERDTATPAERWAKFADMLSTPMLPVDLRYPARTRR